MAQRTVSAGIVGLIGNTPLLRVRLFERDFPGLEVYAKAEWFNPGGSVKDRAALSMILDGEQCGELTHRKTIIDSTSGNTGIAYAMVGAAKGYRVKLVMPGNVSAERKALVAAYGAEIVYSDALEGSDGAIRMVRDLVGLKHLPTAIVPKIWDPSVADEIWGSPTEPAYDLARTLARTEGLLVGHSSGAVLWAVRRLAETVREGLVVTVFPDSGDRYLSTGLYGNR